MGWVSSHKRKGHQFDTWSDKWEAREKERERNIDVQEKHQSIASCTPPTGDLAHNPGMCSDWDSNQ